MTEVHDGTAPLITADVLVNRQGAFARAVEKAEAANEHVWIVTVVHQLSKGLVRKIVRGEASPPLLDLESLVVAGVGCYRCERELEPRLIGGRCRGTDNPPKETAHA